MLPFSATWCDVRALSCLVVTDHRQLEARIPTFRINIKNAADLAVVPHFGLIPGCTEKIEFLLKQMQYICPYDGKVRFFSSSDSHHRLTVTQDKVDARRPYQHPVFLNVFSQFHFTYASDLVRSNLHHFRPSDDNDMEEMPDAMIAAAATAASDFAASCPTR
jgi:hypothetical protein